MKVDVSRLIDDGRWSIYQKFLVACAAVTIILDGIDNQLLGLTVKAMADEWQLQQKHFATAQMMSPLGMMIGGAIGGWLGDRSGRRSALLGSVLAFAVPTAAIYFAHDVFTLSGLRFLAGLGLGGAMPNATALSSEYVPKRFRPFAVTLTIVCIPVGSMLAAFIAGHLPASFGWRNLYLCGGILPVIIALPLFFLLPESPRFLAGRRRRWPELVALLRRFGLAVAPDADFAEGGGAGAKPRGSVRALFAGEYLRDTLALCGAFFFCLLVNYLAFMVLPGALQQHAGFSKSAAGDAMGWWSVSGIVGALAGGYIVHHRGSRMPMLVISALAVVSAFLLMGTRIHADNKVPLMIMLVLLGTMINAAQTTMYALAAHVYPTAIRGTGIGTAVAVGRIGNMLAPWVGYSALERGGMQAYFAVFGIGMIVVFVCLALVRRHIERAPRAARPLEVSAVAGDP